MKEKTKSHARYGHTCHMHRSHMSYINYFYELNSVRFDLQYIRNLIRTPCVISSPFAASRFQKVQEVLRQEWWPCLEGADDRMEVYRNCWASMTFEECLIKWEISIFKQVVAWTISGDFLKVAHSDGTDVLTSQRLSLTSEFLAFQFQARCEKRLQGMAA